jgi:DNA-directed RNA polymerase subunit RPC12/RpoP
MKTMAKCTSCGHAWKAIDIWKLGVAKDGKNCPYCGMKYYPSFKDEGFLVGLGYISGLAALLLIVLFPYYVRLSARKEDSMGMK